MTTHYLYTLTFPNGRVYVGITNNMTRRLYEHRKRARQGFKLPLYSAIRKYGPDKFQVDIIETGTRRQVEDMEITWIIEMENPYNLAPGGALSPMLSAEAQAKARGRKQTPEHIAKRTGTQIGAKRSEESKKRMSEGQKKRDRTPEELDKLKNLAVGRVVSDEHKLKLSVAAKARWAKSKA